MSNVKPRPRTDFIIDPETGCWLWQLRVDKNGYGRTNKNWAHIIYYEQYIGPVPNGLVLDHLCRNSKCVNPWHLEPVTQLINCLRGAKTKYTTVQVQEIKTLKAEGLGYRRIAKLLSIPRATIQSICNGSRRLNA